MDSDHRISRNTRHRARLGKWKIARAEDGKNRSPRLVRDVDSRVSSRISRIGPRSVSRVKKHHFASDLYISSVFVTIYFHIKCRSIDIIVLTDIQIYRVLRDTRVYPLSTQMKRPPFAWGRGRGGGDLRVRLTGSGGKEQKFSKYRRASVTLPSRDTFVGAMNIREVHSLNRIQNTSRLARAIAIRSAAATTTTTGSAMTGRSDRPIARAHT